MLLAPPPILAIKILFFSHTFLILASNIAASYLGSVPIIRIKSDSSIPLIVGLNNHDALLLCEIGILEFLGLQSKLSTFKDFIKSKRDTIDSRHI